MKACINQTLKKNLITNPAPVLFKKEFFQYKERLFCDVNIICGFLDATDSQMQFSYSKKLIHRILYESNYAPAPSLIDYIAQFESKVRCKRSVKHPSRDH